MVAMLKETLESRILDGIPLSRNMAFRVIELAPTTIKVIGDEQPNVNVHGTAFAGSLYCICTLAVWGLVYSRLPGQASLVLASGHIDYLKPVIGNIVAEGSVKAEAMDEFLENLQNKGKSRIDATATIEHDGHAAVRFTASLYARIGD